jgi:hypothetical protein
MFPASPLISVGFMLSSLSSTTPTSRRDEQPVPLLQTAAYALRAHPQTPWTAEAAHRWLRCPP